MAGKEFCNQKCDSDNKVFNYNHIAFCFLTKK